jgi:hypothetical protein
VAVKPPLLEEEPRDALALRNDGGDGRAIPAEAVQCLNDAEME